MKEEKKYRVGLGVSGGIAAYKAVEILRGLQKAGCEVRVAMTRHACEFVRPLTFRALAGGYVFVDDYAPDNPDPIAHINFSQSIDLLVVAPATANTLAKFANGIADDFLSSTYLASNAPVLVAPAMNTTMWGHPATQKNVKRLRKQGVHFVEPVSGRLACETVGAGKLEEVENIVAQALAILEGERGRRGEGEKNELRITNDELRREADRERDLRGERFLITTGGTREEIDPVRYISNYSSGKMGFALAAAARARGARVTVVAGSVSAEPPEGVKIVGAVSAEEMHRAVMGELKEATVFVGAAAVADYRPVKRAASKIKKTDSDNLVVELERTVDILADVSQNRPENLICVGFAAETSEVENYARAKMAKKNLDLIVANDVSREGAGFGADNNQGLILRRDRREPVEIPLMSKREMAHRILDQIAELRGRHGESTGGTAADTLILHEM